MLSIASHLRGSWFKFAGPLSKRSLDAPCLAPAFISYYEESVPGILSWSFSEEILWGLWLQLVCQHITTIKMGGSGLGAKIAAKDGDMRDSRIPDV